ncbi:hypothetical protein SAMN02745166_00817 [Prosthecobacter debontii]|uniref:Uncharacterized protein n=1 Tax=Prosthecobacter debontii TaxID=48467 RepID=A0A1T4WWU2_9BACT|nr:hypothetical protein [Prosthecobacter debontii]SKA81813.1 hypothetical protein SAMN02745166_00817 [Prosthecobacter debontii]
MKKLHRNPKTIEMGRRSLVAAIFAANLLSLNAIAGDPKGVVEPIPEPLQTNRDLPSDFHKYYGQRVNSWKDRERQIAKLDMDADMNQDGTISNTDPADSGAFEATPPGLILGTGELTRVVIRLNPYRIDFDGEVVVSLEVEGINRATKTGDFASLDEELASMGHIRVWKDASKKELLLDSRDPAKRVVEFTTQYKTYPYNLPIAVPRFVFVEGVKPSPIYTGDIRLLVTCAHRAIDETNYADLSSGKTSGKAGEPLPEKKKGVLKSFRTSFDHVLFTVQPKPATKEFINGNVEGVWKSPNGEY